MSREYDKLVRDDIPDLIREDGEMPVTYEADDEEFERRLVEKLEEEVAEYRESRDAEELADVLEVIVTLGGRAGVSGAELRELRESKANRRGRFDERIVLDRVEE